MIKIKEEMNEFMLAMKREGKERAGVKESTTTAQPEVPPVPQPSINEEDQLLTATDFSLPLRPLHHSDEPLIYGSSSSSSTFLNFFVSLTNLPASAKITPAPTKIPLAPAKILPAPAKIPSAPAKIPPAPAKITPAPAKITPAPAKIMQHLPR